MQNKIFERDLCPSKKTCRSTMVTFMPRNLSAWRAGHFFSITLLVSSAYRQRFMKPSDRLVKSFCTRKNFEKVVHIPLQIIVAESPPMDVEPQVETREVGNRNSEYTQQYLIVEKIESAQRREQKGHRLYLRSAVLALSPRNTKQSPDVWTLHLVQSGWVIRGPFPPLSPRWILFSSLFALGC